MRNDILKIVTAVAYVAVVLGQSAYAAASISSDMSRVEVRTDGGGSSDSADENTQDDNIQSDKNNNSIRLEPGKYYITGAKQVRILNSDGNVAVFKGKLDNASPFKAELPSGGTLEYKGTLYLTKASESKNEDVSGASDADVQNDEQLVSPQPEDYSSSQEQNDIKIKQTVLSPFKYSPLTSGDFMRISNIGYSVINQGILEIYNDKNELKEERYIPYAADITGYILSENAGSTEKNTEMGESISLNDGNTYTVGAELKEGSYSGKGNGTVRVYDPDGYVKTVIRLKDDKTPGNDGVNEYIFKLNINETVVPEGDIEFTELISETKDMGNQNK